MSDHSRRPVAMKMLVLPVANGWVCKLSHFHVGDNDGEPQQFVFTNRDDARAWMGEQFDLTYAGPSTPAAPKKRSR